MLNMPRRVRRRLRLMSITAFVIFSFFHLILPADSPVRLAFYFNASRLFNWVRGAATDRDAWLWKTAQYPVDLRNDVGYLIKTGYGTRHRVPGQLEAFAQTGNFLGEEGRGFIVVGDWTTVNETDAKVMGVTVHDAIRKVMETKIDSQMQEYPRFVKYKSLQDQIEAGDEAKALKIGSSFGWELDALKFIMGMEMIYNDLPRKKWYIILDDDTFLVRPSLELLLSHLDPAKPQYIGNAVGDYKGRFAHGGSAILISGEAMRRLFEERPDVVAAAYAESMDETWGDRLVATTFLKLGIYLDERYSHHFNGEPPSITRIRNDRFCSPLVSFHGLRKPGEMAALGRSLAANMGSSPLLWHEVWQLFGREHVSVRPVTMTMQQKHDYVGRTDEHVRSWDDVRSANDCQRHCESDGARWCLAWTYEVETARCHCSPWMLLGAPDAEQKVSGVNWDKAEWLWWQCS